MKPGYVRQTEAMREAGVCLCVFSALYWFNYELVKTRLCQWSQLSQANFSISFTAGAFSGAVSSQTLAWVTSSARYRGVLVADRCYPDAAVRCGEDTETDPAGRNGCTRRSGNFFHVSSVM